MKLFCFVRKILITGTRWKPYDGLPIHRFYGFGEEGGGGGALKTNLI